MLETLAHGISHGLVVQPIKKNSRVNAHSKQTQCPTLVGYETNKRN